MKMMELERETLHQLARSILGTADRGMPENRGLAVRAAAQAIADATASRDGPANIQIALT